MVTRRNHLVELPNEPEPVRSTQLLADDRLYFFEQS